MATLFDLTGEALALQRQINESAELLFSDDPDEAAQATAELKALICSETDNRKEIERKADSWCWVINQLQATAAARAAHAQRLKGLAAVAEHQADLLADRLFAALAKIDPDATRWELPEHKITSRRSQAVEVSVDVMRLPTEYTTSRTTISPDKTALAAALKGGAQIEGVALVERRSWKIA